jgi:hypothetical protein
MTPKAYAHLARGLAGVREFIAAAAIIAKIPQARPGLCVPLERFRAEPNRKFLERRGAV